VSDSKYNIVQPLLLSIVLAIGMLVGYRLNNTGNVNLVSKIKKENNQSLKSIEEVIGLIDNRYLYRTNTKNISNILMQKAVSVLDPFSKYIAPKKYKSISDRLEGHFTGLGIESMFINDTLNVINVIKKSPAEKAGIKSLDKILQLGNVSIVGRKESVTGVRKIIQKYNSKDLDLLIVNRDRKIVPITVKISKIEKNSIDKNFIIGDSIIYVSISQFTKYTYRDFMETIEKYVSNDRLGKLIIDLRNNPGGYLREVTKILDQFFDTSKLLMVKTVYKDGRGDILKTSGRTFYTIRDVVVLINENSASGSEVMAGVLQDYDRATIVGKPSFGKGLVQEQFDLDNGGALRLTIANYYLPTGRSIQKQLNLDSNYVDLKSSQYENKDTFYSLNKNRPLMSGSGIYPDTLVNDSGHLEIDYLFWEKDSLFLEWSVKYIHSHRQLLKMDEEKFINEFTIKIDSTILSDLEMVDIKDQSLFEQHLKSKIGFILFGKNIEGKVLVDYDPFIAKALDVLKKR